MHQPSQKILLVNRTTPYSNLRAQEALDVLLMASAFGQTISILFMEDGVLQLINQQQPEMILRKPFTKTFKALSLYDINKVYVAQSSLIKYGLNLNDLIIEAELIDSDSIGKLMQQQDVILNF